MLPQSACNRRTAVEKLVESETDLYVSVVSQVAKSIFKYGSILYVAVFEVFY